MNWFYDLASGPDRAVFMIWDGEKYREPDADELAEASKPMHAAEYWRLYGNEWAAPEKGKR